MTLNPTNVSIIKRLLVGRTSRPLRSILSRLSPPDLAILIGMLNEREVRLLLEALNELGKAGLALSELPEQQLSHWIRRIESQTLINIVQSSSEDNAADLLSALDEVSQKDLLDQLEPNQKRRLQQVLNYDEDSAGRMMSSRVFTVPSQLTVAEALEHIRSRVREISIYYIYCVDDEGKLMGVVSLRDLVTTSPQTPLFSLAKTDVVSVAPDTHSEEVARLVSYHDFIAVPVVAEDKRLLGVITVDDVLDIIQDQATANIYASAGLQEDDRVYSPSVKSIKNRLPWMFLNLILASIASSVISLFEATMSELIILASLNNIVAGMAGNTAIQTLTVVTRGIATGDFQFISQLRGILKETVVGLTVGFFTGLAAGLLVFIWKGSAFVGVVIFASMTLNAIVAASIGAAVPLGMKKLGVDPAAGSGVIVTMLADIFGFFSFLGLAAGGLRYFG